MDDDTTLYYEFPAIRDLDSKRQTKEIEALRGILWGYTSKECLPVLDEFE